MDTKTLDRWAYTASEVGVLMGISRSQAYALIKSGTLPSVRLGGKLVRVPRESLRAWIRDNEQSRDGEAGL
jgi:excisionase family DNA binding protein